MKTIYKYAGIALVLALYAAPANAQALPQQDQKARQLENERRIKHADSIYQAHSEFRKVTKSELKAAQQELRVAQERYQEAKRRDKDAANAMKQAKRSLNMEKKAQKTRQKANEQAEKARSAGM